MNQKNDEKIDLAYFLKEDNLVTTRLLLMASFEFYIRFMFKVVNDSDITIKPFHKKIINKLQGLVFGTNEKRNLAINIPVGAGKSLICEYFITWCFCRNINNAFLYVSHSDMLIHKLSKEAKDICDHEIWIKIFRNQLKSDEKSKVNWGFDKSKNRTGLTAGTMGGGLTGLDAGNPNIKDFNGALIIDDPIDVGKIRYSKARKDTIVFYDEKLSTRRRSPKTPTILIHQRLHKNDLTGWAIANEPEDWDVLTIKAMENGESFWPERYPVEELNKIQRINPFKYAAQYDQDPITLGGNVIKREYFNFYKKPPKFRRIFLTADTAQKTKEHNDFTVFMAWGVTESNLYVLDMLRGKWEAPELLINGRRFWSKWRHYQDKHCTAFYIEDKVSGTGLIQNFQRDSMIPVVALQKNTDKLMDTEDSLPFIAAGKVLLPKDETYYFNPDILKECEAFTRDDSHDHDDIVDNINMAIKQTLGGDASILDVL